MKSLPRDCNFGSLPHDTRQPGPWWGVFSSSCHEKEVWTLEILPYGSPGALFSSPFSLLASNVFWLLVIRASRFRGSNMDASRRGSGTIIRQPYWCLRCCTSLDPRSICACFLVYHSRAPPMMLGRCWPLLSVQVTTRVQPGAVLIWSIMPADERLIAGPYNLAVPSPFLLSSDRLCTVFLL